MADYTAIAGGDFNTDGGTVWDIAGHPDGADDTATIPNGMAITAAAAVVCGAITLTGTGSLVAEGAANTITSVTNNGTGALTLGATTFAGVLNNASTGTLTINGNLTGVTMYTMGNCNQNANVACTGFANAASRTWTMANGTEITGMTATCTAAGTWSVGAGCAITPTLNGSVSISGASTSIFVISGTSGAHTTITNANASGTLQFQDFAFLNWSWVDLDKGWSAIRLAAGYTRLVDCDIQGKSGRVINAASAINARVVAERCFFSNGNNATDGLYLWVAIADLRDCTFGANRAGTPGTFSASDINLNSPGVVCVGSSVRCLSTTQIATSNGAGFAHFDHWGYAGSTGTPGVYYSRDCTLGSIIRSVDSPYGAETYHTRAIPGSTVEASKVLPAEIFIPVTTSDVVTVAGKVRRTTLTSTTCATVRTDPEQAFSATASTTPTLTDAGGENWYDYSVNSGAVTGTGNMRIVLECTSYTAAGYLDWSGITITVTHADASTTIYRVSHQYGANGMPIIDPPDYPTVAEVEDGVTFDYSKTGTYDPITGNYTDPGKANVTVGNDYTFAGVAQVAEFDEAARNTDPGAANVVKDVAYTILNVAKTGTFDEAARNTDPGVANVKDGTTYQIQNASLEGTYDPMAAAVFPAEATVSTTVTAYGPTGAEYAGALNLALYTLISGVVSADYVVVGNNNYSGGSAGTYPTTATSQAAQLAIDVAVVNAEKDAILSTAEILGVTGTFDLDAYEAGRNEDPGIANVKNATTYQIRGVSLEGTAALAQAFTLSSSTTVITKR